MNILVKTTLIILCLMVFFWIIDTPIAYAGMPSIVLTKIAKLRLTTISFFLFIYILSVSSIFTIWNYVQKDFPQLPKLSFVKAMALVFLWGLAMQLILVMVAGTRELMTPKAWESAGIIYELTPDAFQKLIETRQYKLEILKKELWNFAKNNSGKFPTKRELKAISEDILLDSTGKNPYNYVENLTLNSPFQPLAYEADTFGNQRMVLFTNGNIEILEINLIEKLIGEVK